MPYTNMSAFSRAMLTADVSREQRGEIEMWREYESEKAEEARTDSEWGIIGSIVLLSLVAQL